MNDGHKVEGCTGKWIDVGTLRDPYRQLCAVCRGSRQKPADDDEVVDVAALKAAEERHLRGLTQLKADLEATEAWRRDAVHQDEEGFWFWDESWSVRYGPYETEAVARDCIELYVQGELYDPAIKPGVIERSPSGCLKALGWLAFIAVFWGAVILAARSLWKALTQ
jgi:hypothetical protein